MFKIDVRIDPSIARRLEELRENFPDEVGVALQNEAARIAHTALERAPHDEGALAGSAFVERPGGTSSTQAVELGFGAPYALYIEERTDLHHPGGGEAKFLARSLDAAAAGMAERLAADLQPAFEKGAHVTPESTLPTSSSTTSPSHHSSRRARAARQLRRR